ncbi:purine/pyrimidine permease [Paenibacillus faecalis]|uniref:purine/pyrimidine permease n=1 Tax=Paenibacillus faecalis TaxID=2079532 RepID=UPI000D0FFADF|nr:purine/pyrimidine permease [Paenibacillus faecalis]
MKSRAISTGIFSIQWLVFLIANSLMLPIVIGTIFQMSPEETIGLIQRMFFVVGLSSLLSAWLGHRLPIPDGPAGIWLGIFVLMGQLAVSQGGNQDETLRLLEGGMLVTGITVILIGSAKWMQKLLRIFTPLVTGVYLIMLTLQLSGTLLKGMIGVSDTGAPVLGTSVVISFSVFLLVLSLSIWGKGWMKSYAVLFGVIAGWIAYALVYGTGQAPASDSLIKFPQVFAWGLPTIDAGMFATAIMVAFVLISSVIACLVAMQQVVDDSGKKQTPRTGKTSPLDKAGIVSGFSNVLSSLFSTIGVVPLSISAGFVRLTGQIRLAPYYIACALLIIISFIPGIYSMLSLLPAQVANAAMLASFAQMIGIGIRSILKEPLDERRMTILGLALSFGTGVMFLPQSLFYGLPTIFQYLLGNGVMVGMLVALLLEQTWREKAAKAATL